MKLLIISVVLSTVALGQTPTKTITFNRADTEHCRVVAAAGKPLLESTYEGTSVAVAMPLNSGNGEFLVFVAVSRTGSGAVQIDPKDFFGLLSDAAHTRFTFHENSESLGTIGAPSFSAADAGVDPGSLRPGAVGPGGPPPGGGPTGGPPPGEPGAGAPMAGSYLHRSKIKSGAMIAGWVSLRQPKGNNIEVHATDMLGEIDIPVNGVIFRF